MLSYQHISARLFVVGDGDLLPFFANRALSFQLGNILGFDCSQVKAEQVKERGKRSHACERQYPL
jgi:hypothetical protein